VRIRLWIPYVTARLWIVLLVTFVAGALVGMLFARRRTPLKSVIASATAAPGSARTRSAR
jgi:hypothetical protein